MKEFCTCSSWDRIKKDNPKTFFWDDVYGWLIVWIELTKERNHKKIHNYGLSIKYCPLCGKKLETPL